MVESTIPVFHRLARILIDFGATHSFVNSNFMCVIDMRLTKLSYDLEVRTPMGEHCEFWVGERRLTVDLITLPIRGYDVIIGMDCLV